MNELQLSAEEVEVLQELLQHQIEEMSVEVGRTDTREFKEKLKHRRELLERIEGKLSMISV